MKELTGIIINPTKRKRRKAKKSIKTTVRKRRKISNRRNPLQILIRNPAKDHQALLELAAGTTAGLAAGKLLDHYVFSKVNLPIPAGISAGDVATLAGGLFLLKQNKQREFATGVVAGAGAKILLNVLDSFIFHGQGVVGLHGEGEEGYYFEDDNGQLWYVDAEGNAYPAEEEASEVNGECTDCTIGSEEEAYQLGTEELFYQL
ncbi:hypothetical protein [Desulfurobacterium sp.]